MSILILIEIAYLYFGTEHKIEEIEHTQQKISHLMDRIDNNTQGLEARLISIQHRFRHENPNTFNPRITRSEPGDTSTIFHKKWIALSGY